MNGTLNGSSIFVIIDGLFCNNQSEKKEGTFLKKSKTSAQYGQKNKARVGNIIIACVVCIFAVGLLGFSYVLWTVGKVHYNPITQNPSDIGANMAISDNKITNIALFGVDSRNGEASRSDAIMILSVDNKHKKIKLASILRDSYVEVPDNGMTKINHAYAYGGPELAIRTINENFGLDIMDYVTVNFDQLANVIDAIGGVDIELSEEERVSANQNIYTYAAESEKDLPLDYIDGSGLQHLSGMQAVAYARIRNVGGGDYERTDRQRRVLQQMFNKVMDMNVTSYPGLVNKLLPLVETSLDSGEIISLGLKALAGGKPVFEQTRFPLNEDFENGGAGTMIDGLWYMVFDIEATAQKIQAFIYDDVHPDDGTEAASSSADGDSGDVTEE